MKIDLHLFQNSEHNITVSHQRQKDPTGVVVVFPGGGYGPMGPCLYYPSNLFLELGFEIINIEYDFRKQRISHLGQVGYQNFYEFLMQNLRPLFPQGPKLALCKSIGSRIVASVQRKDFEKYIWMTPTLKEDFVIQSIKSNESNSFVIIGSQDSLYDENNLNIIKKCGVHVYVAEGADHGLDIEGSIEASIKTISNTVQFLERSLANNYRKKF